MAKDKQQKSQPEKTQSTATPPAPAEPKPAKAPKLTKEERLALPVTDARRPLTKDEKAALSDEDKAARREHRETLAKARNEKRGPWRTRVRRMAASAARSSKKLARFFGGASDEEKIIAADVEKALGLFNGVLLGIEELPSDWKPTRKAGGPSRAYAAGASVVLREKARVIFADALDDVSESLTIVRSIGEDGKRYVAKASDGTKLVVTIGQIEAAE